MFISRPAGLIQATMSSRMPSRIVTPHAARLPGGMGNGPPRCGGAGQRDHAGVIIGKS